MTLSTVRWWHRSASWLVAVHQPKLMFALALLLIGSTGAGLHFVPENHAHDVARSFIEALQGDSEVEATAYLAPNADVYLQGSSAPMAAADFQKYLAVLKRGGRAFRAASRIYMNESGAGWLLNIDYVEGAANANPSISHPQPQLWMQTTIDGNQITRVWIHFTVDALSRSNMPPEVYRKTAEARGTPVPEGWTDGTDAMLDAADRVDWKVSYSWANTVRQLLMLLPILSLALATVGLVTHLGRQQRSAIQRPATAGRGEMLIKLREACAARDQTAAQANRIPQ